MPVPVIHQFSSKDEDEVFPLPYPLTKSSSLPPSGASTSVSTVESSSSSSEAFLPIQLLTTSSTNTSVNIDHDDDNGAASTEALLPPLPPPPPPRRPNDNTPSTLSPTPPITTKRFKQPPLPPPPPPVPNKTPLSPPPTCIHSSAVVDPSPSQSTVASTVTSTSSNTDNGSLAPSILTTEEQEEEQGKEREKDDEGEEKDKQEKEEKKKKAPLPLLSNTARPKLIDSRISTAPASVSSSNHSTPTPIYSLVDAPAATMTPGHIRMRSDSSPLAKRRKEHRTNNSCLAPEPPQIHPLKQNLYKPSHGKLKILICSGNMGNAPPTQDGMDAWIPNDGRVIDMKPEPNSSPYALGVPYPTRDNDDDGDDFMSMSDVYDSTADGRTQNAFAPPSPFSVSSTILDEDALDHQEGGLGHPAVDEALVAADAGYFDIIVVAMQESTFSRGSQSSIGDPDSNTIATEDDASLGNSNHPTQSSYSRTLSVAGKAADIAVRPIGEVGRGIERTVVAPLITAVGSKDHNKKGWFGIVSKITRRNKNRKKLQQQRGTVSAPARLISPPSAKNRDFYVSQRTRPNPTSERDFLLDETARRGSNRSLGSISFADDATTTTVNSRLNVDEIPGAATAATLVRGARRGVEDVLKPVLNHPTEWAGGTQRIYRLLEEQCPSYAFPVRYQRGEMRLIIMVRDDIADEVENVRVVGENTGIGSVLANKGGIVATMNLRKTKLTFLAAHLEAHEGRYANRLGNILEILSGTRETTGVGYDVTMSSHHMFVCGDLNFRINYNPKNVRKMIKNKNWEGLNERDELQQGLENGELLLGFKTLPCLFPPTFKLMRKSGFMYKDQRTPSYTDRILWKSAPGFSRNIRPLAYEPVGKFATSDHKPIRGAFLLETNWMPESSIRSDAPIWANPRNLVPNQVRPSPRVRSHSWSHTNTKLHHTGNDRGKEDFHILVTNMSCKDLPKSRNVFMKTDPYIMFVTDPCELLRQKRSKWDKLINRLGMSTYKQAIRKDGTMERMQNGWPRTRKFADELNPNWKSEKVHLKFRNPSSPHSKLDLTGGMLYLTVMDFDHGKFDKIVGTVPLNLKKLSERATSYVRGSTKESKIRETARKIDINEPLLKNGMEQGTLQCQLTLWWIRDHEERESIPRRFSKGILVPHFGNRVRRPAADIQI